MNEPIQSAEPVISQPKGPDVLFRVKEFGATHWQLLILGGIVIAAFLFCYLDVFKFLVIQWWGNNIYSYGFVIPWISLYLIWIRRDKLAHLQPDPNYVGGLLVLFTGLLMFLLGNAGEVILVQELSLIPTIVGLVLLLLGTNFFQALWFPLTYLLFMIPVWEIITDPFQFNFQLFSATLSVNLIRFVGIPVLQQANYISLPNITLEVAKECSGVNYLLAVIAISIPLAYLFLNGWKKIALVCFAVIVGVLTNGLRIFLIGVLSYYGIGGNIHGPYHVLQGLSVSVMGYGAIFLGLSILTRIPSASLPLKKEPITTPDDAHLNSPKRNVLYGAVLATGLLLFAGSYFPFVYTSKPVHLIADLQTLPLQIGAWEGKDAVTVDNPYAELHVDQELSRVYFKDMKAMKRGVHLYIGYFEDQTQGKEVIYYKVRDYFRNGSKATVRLNDGTSIDVIKGFGAHGKDPRLSMIWYDLDGRVVTNPYLGKLYTSWSGLTRGETNGAVIWVSSEISGGVSRDEASSNMEEFIREVFPLLPKYLPYR